ncbi:MAG: ABC-type transport auxiliary lipoprotein family protein [Rhodospirillales bacterium]|nr:ABC-type transport auxiliary lipoprotein family protein [Rhodospirillales bacterium]MDP6774757.1 ABC-type transport auxiliary lipoprotein family protein [Rhodospirillales bacterium]
MRKASWSLFLLLVPALGACAQPPVPQDTFYRLEVGAPEKVLSVPHLQGTLEIERLSADGLTAGRPIVYSRSDRPRELQEYHYHFWTEPPPVMLRDQLVAYLRRAKVASAIVTPEMRVAVDYALTGKIKRLERVIGASSGAAKAIVELELGVRQTAGERLLFLDTYRVETAAAADTVSAAVDALNEGLNRVFALFVADLSKN